MSKFIVQMRRGTQAQWLASDVVPRAGEIVVEIDEDNSLHKLKIGDGETEYADLAYLMAGDEIVSQVLPRVITVTLNVNAWIVQDCATESGLSYHKQTLALSNISANSRLDLQPDADMLAEFQRLNLTFTTENKNGVITVYSFGDLPTKSYTMQASIVSTEGVAPSNKVMGNTVGTPAPSYEVDIALANKKIDYLTKLTKGQAWTTEENSNVAYSKTVPSGAKCAGIKKVGGKTIVWNQIANPKDASTVTDYDITCTFDGNGKFVISGTTEARQDVQVGRPILLTIGHKYLSTALLNYDTSALTFYANDYTSYSNYSSYENPIFTSSIGGYFVLTVTIYNNQTVNIEGYDTLFDLTEMFGAGNEPSTVAEFKEMFPADYYAYNTGTLMSIPCTAIVSKNSSNNTLGTYAIPSDLITALSSEGYGQSNGSTYNYIDFEQKKYYKFGSYVDGVWTADVKTIDISSYLGNDNLLTVDGNGSLTFKNSTNYKVGIPSKVEYAINLSEATQ